jgi:hypothetical protein
LTPDTDQSIDKILKKHQIKFLRLRAQNYKRWSHIDDPHWSCLGHRKAAKQVSAYMENNRMKNQ